MAQIKFQKMEGAGNDFVVIDNREAQFSLEEIIAFTPKLCNRRFGIGADGLMALENPSIDNVDYTMLYRNADGSDAGMCGNGSRCLALFAATRGFNSSQIFNVHNSIYKAEVELDRRRVSVGFPDVKAPVNLELDKTKFIQVYTGTEHVVQFVDESLLDDEKELVNTGSKIRYHEILNPPGTNVNFVSSIQKEAIELQTYERGVEGLTLACGTGAIASAIATHFHENTDGSSFNYSVKVKGGVLNVRFDFNKKENIYQNIQLIGPANFVFEGIVHV